MALFPFPVSLTACFVFVVLVHKMMALLMLGSLGNIFGLPDYVIGEILSSSHMLSKERPIDASSGQSLDQSQRQRSGDWEPPDDRFHPRNANMLYSGPGITLLGEDVLIRNSFPGRISAQAVRIRTISESDVSLSVKSHFFTPADESRFTFESANASATLIAVGDNVIGNVYFDPSACKSQLNCDSASSYTGFQTAIDSGVVYDEEDEGDEDWDSGASRSVSRHLMWSNGHLLDQDSIELEVKMYKILSERWTKQQERHETVNVTLNLETDSGHLLSVSTSATLNWPTLISGSKRLIRFPLTKLGTSVTREVFIENPSSHPLSVQAVIAHPSLYPKDFLTSLSSWSGAEWKDMDPGQAFRVVLNGEVGSASRMVTIPVGQRIKLGVMFQPVPPAADPSTRSHRKSSSTDPSSKLTGVLLIRNNLTIFDSLRLDGETGQGLLRIGKDVPGLTSMLTLDITDKILTGSCKRKNSKSAASAAVQVSVEDQQLTFKKEFTLVNYGKIPVTVKGYLIGPHVGVSSSSYKSKSTLASLSDEPIGSNTLLSGLIGHLPCQGFGFRVVNCDTPLKSGANSSFEPFVLEPNASRKISIAFAPDFTIAKSMATLTVLTDDGPGDTDLQKNWMRVLEEHFLPSAATVASGRKWLSILTTGVSSSTKSQQWMRGYESRNKENLISESRPKNGVSGLNLITYSVIATVPKSLLSVCDQSLPRPNEEMILYYTLVVFMICLVTVTCAFAFIDGTRVLNFSFYPAVLLTRPASEFDAASIHPFKPFDLNGDPASDKNNMANNKNPDAKQQNGSWTSYLKSKLVSPRRGSTGSSASSVSGDGGGGKAGGTSTTSAAKSGTKSGNKSGKKNSAKHNGTVEEAQLSSLRRRLNAKTWFETLSNRNRQEKETVKIPLPTFEDEFDDQDIQNLKGQKGKSSQKGNKKEKESLSPQAASSSHSSTGTSTASGSSSPIAAVPLPVPVTAAGTISMQAMPCSRAEQSSSARTSPKTTLMSCSSSGIGSFELPYNPGKGRRCESMSAVPSDVFSHNGSYKESPASDFGFWEPDNASSKSSVDNNMEIWDSPITMFDPQKALLDLSKKQAAAATAGSGGRTRPVTGENKHQDAAGVSKSALCAFAPTPSTTFPAVGLFDPSLVHRQVQTPSPRGWSPSHKSLQASMSMPVSSDVSRTTPSPIAVSATQWEPEKDVLSRLRESSTDWIRGPTRVTTPVQRPQNGSMWPDAAPGGGRVADKSYGFWSHTGSEGKAECVGTPSSSWNPLSGGGSGFSLFGRSLWSPLPPPPPPGLSPVTSDSVWNSPDEHRN